MNYAQVVIYNGLSTSYGSMLLNLWRDATRLEEQGIGYVRQGKTLLYGLASHESLVRLLRQRQGLENYQKEKLADWLHSFGPEAEKHHTLLITACCPWVEPLELLRQELRTLPGLQRARFRVLLHFSPQEAVLEQRLRLAGSRQGLEFWKNEWLQSDVVNIADMVTRLQAAYGKPNVSVCVGDDDPAESPADVDTGHFLYAMLRCPPPPHFIPWSSLLTLHSREARHIQCLYSQLGNAWPAEVNFTTLLDGLCRTESALGESGLLDFRTMASPEELRSLKECCAAGKAQLADMYPAMEKLLSLPPDKDTAPSLWEPYQGLRPNLVAAIAELLPPATATGLREVLQLDDPAPGSQARILLDGLEKHILFAPLRPASSPLSGSFSPAPVPAPENKVSVLMQTYNQEAYVAEALESILAQKTKFGVEIIVVDDASTDGTRGIVDSYARRYGNIRPFFLPVRSNAGQNTLTMFRHVRTPYVALCDGDDYFTDPEKLQIQVEYLDANPACALCFHPVRVTWEDGSPEYTYPDFTEITYGKRDRYSLTELFRANFIQTNSVMYRWRFGTGIPAWFDPMLVPGDWYWHLLHAELGYIGCIDRVMSVYRRHSSSLFWRPREASTVEHRLRFGIQELRLYQKLEEHFKKRGQKALRILVRGVFADLVKYSMETNNSAPLNKAVRYFPEFARDFLGRMKMLKHTEEKERGEEK